MLDIVRPFYHHPVRLCTLNFCKYYVFGKQCRVSFKISSQANEGVFDYVHTDI